MPSSPWAATGSAGNATAATTPLGTQAGVDGAQNGVNQINSVDYLSNQDKIQLRRDWDAEQQIKTQLDAQASAMGVSATAYDNAVAALSTNLISAGAPSGWATTWPDGTTFAVTSIVINLRTWWSSIATNRASLQKACQDKIQANAAYADALARSSNNLIKNSNSENANPTGVEANGVVAYGYHSGTKCRTLVASGGYDGPLPLTTFIPCSVGDQFYLQAYGYRTSAGAGNARMYLTFYAADQSTITGYVSIEALTTSYPATPYSNSMIAPTNSSYVRVALENDLVTAAVEVYWDDMYLCRKISTGMLQADAIQTSNYAETSGNPTAGAKMDISSTALKVAAGNLQLGATIFSDYLLPRILQALDGNTTNGRLWYRGNVDTTTLSGAPNIGRLTVTRRRWDTTNKIGRLELALAPSAATDNLDAMRNAKITLYRQSAAGTTATLTAVDTYFPQVNDRLYYLATSDSNAGNVNTMTFETVDSLISAGFPAALITLYNAYGPSNTNCFYAAAANADGSALTNNGTSWPAGITGASGGGSGGGGGGGGGGCPAPWVKIQLASGLLVDAADLYDGAVVAGVDDNTLEPMVGIVRSPQITWADRVPIHLEDGTVTEFSAPHRFMVEGKGWTEARNLVPGDSIMAQQPSIVRSVGLPIKAQVVTFSVDGCHTYFSDGLLSHNQKPL